MKASDLLPFCCDLRLPLMAPFTIGEFTYATNGKLLLRTPKLEDAGTSEFPLEKLLSVASQNRREPFKVDDLTQWAPIPEIESEEKRFLCWSCSEDEDMEVLAACGVCKGVGVTSERIPKTRWARLGNRSLNTHLLLDLAKLPGIQVCAEVGCSKDFVYLRFDGGGVGVLMPLNPEHGYKEDPVILTAI